MDAKEEIKLLVNQVNIDNLYIQTDPTEIKDEEDEGKTKYKKFHKDVSDKILSRIEVNDKNRTSMSDDSSDDRSDNEGAAFFAE